MRTAYALLGLALFFTAPARAQDLSVPSNWRSPAPALARNDSIRVAQAGLDTVLPFYTPANGRVGQRGTFYGILSFYDSAQVFWTMALKDFIAGSTNNSFVQDGIDVVNLDAPNFGQVDGGDNQTPVYWGMASIQAYRAYNNQTMLAVAQHIWSIVAPYQITHDQAASGTAPSRNITFLGTCGRTSVEGALLASTVANNAKVSASVTAYFVLLSAHLHELTNGSNPAYLAAAVAGAAFLRIGMLDETSGILSDSLTLGTNGAQCTLDTPASSTSYTTGAFIEALSVLADASGDPQWADQMLDTLVAATKNNKLWLDSHGIMVDGMKPGGTDDDKSYKGKFVRSLYEPWARSNRTDVRNLISAFVNVQANAVLDLATSSGSNNYSANWNGPPATNFTWAGALAGLDVLTAAIAPAGFMQSNPNSPAAALGGSPAKAQGGNSLVLGLAIGLPIVVLLLAALALVLARRRRRRRPCSDRKWLYVQDYERGATPASAPTPPYDPSTAPSPLDTTSARLNAASASVLVISPVSSQRGPDAGCASSCASVEVAFTISPPPSTFHPEKTQLAWGGVFPGASRAVRQPSSRSGSSATAAGSVADDEKRRLSLDWAAQDPFASPPLSRSVSATSTSARVPADAASFASSSGKSLGWRLPGEKGAAPRVLPREPTDAVGSASPGAYADLPTPELVRILNERLRTGGAGPEDVDELPVYDDEGRR